MASRHNAASFAFFVPFTVAGIKTPLASYTDHGVFSAARDSSFRVLEVSNTDLQVRLLSVLSKYTLAAKSPGFFVQNRY